MFYNLVKLKQSVALSDQQLTGCVVQTIGFADTGPE